MSTLMCPTCWPTSSPRPKPSPSLSASSSCTSSSHWAQLNVSFCPSWPMTGSWQSAAGFLWFLIPVILVTQLPFCGPNVIDDFLCDLGPLLALASACVPIPGTVLICGTVSSLLIFATFFYIMGSYTLVLRAVVQVPSHAGRKKAFSTCSSHLAVVFLFYGSVMITYVSPGSGQAEGMQKFTTLFYSVLTPFFNPMIYSLRNKEMKDALKKVLGGS